MPSPAEGQFLRASSLLTEDDIYKTEKPRRKILVGVRTPYDYLLESSDPRVQYYLDLIKVRLALSSGTLPLKDAFAAVKLLENDPEFVVGHTFGPLPENWPLEMTERIVDNLKLLHKSRAMEASTVYSAIIDTLTFRSPSKPPSGLLGRVFSYFVYHPLASFTDAAKGIQCHRSTVRAAYAKLVDKYRIMPLSLLNGCAFGISSFMLFFELNSDVEWEMIRDPLLQFPFTKTLHRVTTSPFGYVSFSIPGSKQNEAVFRSSVERVAHAFFQYSSLHKAGTMTRYANPSLINGDSWDLPECLISGTIEGPVGYKPAVASIGCPRYLEGLTKDDFITSEIVSYHLRSSNAELARILQSRGRDTTPSQVSYRIEKMMRMGVMSPWIWWCGVGLHYNFMIELVCNDAARSTIFEAVSGLPEVFTTITDRGGAIMLDIPSYHLKNYYDFLSSLMDLAGVKSIRPILAVMRSGGKNYIDMFGDLEFGRRGFSDASDHVNLMDYLP